MLSWHVSQSYTDSFIGSSLQGKSKDRFLRMGRVVFLRSTAYRTSVHIFRIVYFSRILTSCASWEAFVRFVYFGKIDYAKLKSSYKNKEEAAARFSEQRCSPKSMYRFAQQVGGLCVQVLIYWLLVRYRIASAIRTSEHCGAAHCR